MGLLIPVISLVLCVFILPSDAALAAMSIDLGSQYIKIGLVKPGVPMEIVLNKESRRKTPNIMAIRNEERFFAEVAAALATKYPQSSYQYLLNLLGKQQGEPSVELYKQRFPFASFSFDEARNTVVFDSASEKYNVETLLAMILWSAKQTTEAFAGQSVKDVVITVPIFFNQAERRALAAAADIAGLNLLQLLNDGSAAALNYGVFRRKEITEKPQTMLIYDMGASKTTATLVEYVLEVDKLDKNNKDKNPVVRTIGVGYDRSFGGLEVTMRLSKHLEQVFRETVKTPTDIATNARSMAKLVKEAERVKQVLSANKDTYAQVEGLHEEQNFRAKVTREELEALIVDLDDRYLQPIKDALAMAEKTIADVDQFVLMGAGTRLPKVQESLKTILGDKEIGRFLNTDEAIALGAVYQAAHLSKSFKVLPFAVHELVLFPVVVNFETKTESGDKKPTSRPIFGYKTHYPTSKKIISFQSYEDDFEVSLTYGSLSHLNDAQLKEFSTTTLSSLAVAGVKSAIEQEVKDTYHEPKGVKVSFGIDLSGIVSISKADYVVEKRPTETELEEYEKSLEEFKAYEKADNERKEAEKKKLAEEKKKKKEEKEKAKKDGEKNETEEAAEKTEEATTTEEPEKKETVEPLKKVDKPKEPKKQTIKTALNITTEYKDIVDLTSEQIESSKKLLSEFHTKETAKHEREEAMNSLESFVYDLAVKTEEGEEFAEFLTAEEKEKIDTEVKRLRLWLEDDVSLETTTEEFKANKKILDDLTAKPNMRKSTLLDRPKIIEGLTQMLNHSEIFYASALNMTDSEDPVFTVTEIEALSKLMNETKDWWTEQSQLIEAQKKNEDPAVENRAIVDKIRDLDREVKYLLNKLKTFVPKKKTKEEKPKKEKKATKDSKEKSGKEEKENVAGTEEDMFAGVEDVFAGDAEAEETTKKAEHDASEL